LKTFKRADGRRVSTGFSLHNQRTLFSIPTYTAVAISEFHTALTASGGGQIRPHLCIIASMSENSEKSSKTQAKRDAFISTHNISHKEASL